jgi:choice-of-anchor C domain-containing protein
MKLKMILGMILILATSTIGFGQLVNGSFEGSAYSGGSFYPLFGGSTAIPGWIVGDFGLGGPHGVDLITNYWDASDGVDSVDLSGYAAGSISQTFPTVPGVTYKVTFDMSANPDGGPRVYSMSVDATGNAAATYTYDTGAKGNSSNFYAPNGDMKWETMTYSFTATSASTTLTFSDITPPIIPYWFGPGLDNVRLTFASGQVCHRNNGKAAFKTLTLTDPASYADHIGHGDVAGACSGS